MTEGEALEPMAMQVVDAGGLAAVNQWEKMLGLARVLVKSQFLPSAIKTPEQALAIILTGQELGWPPMTALRRLYVINGKVELYADGMLALAYGTKELEQFDRQDSDDQCTIIVKRRGFSPVTSTFTLADAKRAGLAEGTSWHKFPKAMLYARALSAALRQAFADVLAGIYTQGEVSGDSPSIYEGIPPQETEESVPIPWQARSGGDEVENLGTCPEHGPLVMGPHGPYCKTKDEHDQWCKVWKQPAKAEERPKAASSEQVAALTGLAKTFATPGDFWRKEFLGATSEKGIAISKITAEKAQEVLDRYIEKAEQG